MFVRRFKVTGRCALVCAQFAGGLLLSVSDRALAACTASAVTGHSFECDGLSTFSGTVTNTGTNPSVAGDAGNAAIQLAPGSVFTNNGVITVFMGAAPNNTTPATPVNGFQRTRLYGVSADDAGDYVVNNNGTISVTHMGVGRLWGVVANGDATSVELNNAAGGLVEITRGSLTNLTVSATTLTARAAGLAANQALDVAAASYSEEEADAHITNNAGTLRASGLLTSAVYGRAEETVIVNSGLIIQTTPTQGFAIAKVSDSGEVRTLDLTNSGTISGDILAVGGQAQRWWGLSRGLGGTIDARLNINSQFGQVDSTITNSGTITGNIYYGNGAHMLTNDSGGIITGDINVDQRMMTVTGRTCTVGAAGCFATATTAGTVAQGNPTTDAPAEASATTITTAAVIGGTSTYTVSMWGPKSFSFENAGTYNGNLTVQTQAPVAVGGFTSPDSTVTLLPHIFGGGSGSTLAAPSTNSGFIDGTLKVADGIVNGAGGTGSLARTTTIAPIVDGPVRNHEFYLVARQVAPANIGDNPTVLGTALVQWEAHTSTGALVIESNIASASTIAGLSTAGANSIDALNASTSTNANLKALTMAIQGLGTAADVKKAGEQLRPETNGAAIRVPTQVANLVQRQINSHLTGSGGNGGSGPGIGFAPPSGLGMAPKVDPNRSNLGAGGGEDSGPATANQAVWAQGFGARLEQDSRSNIDGYTADIGGVAGGYDYWVTRNLRVGGGVGVATSTSNNIGATRGNQQNIDSYLAFLYASWGGPGVYLNTNIGYGNHEYSGSRTISIGGVTDTALRSYSGDQFNAGAEAGVPIRLGGATVVPTASINYSSLDQVGYTETSKAGAALRVGSDQSNSVVSGLGLRALIPIIASAVALETRAMWLHELGDTAQLTTASFVAGSPAFVAAGVQESRDTIDLGVGLRIGSGTSTGTTLAINYDAAVRDDFVAHAGSLRARIGF